MLSVTVIPGIECLLGSQKSCLLVSSFPSGPSSPPTGPAVPTDAPAWPLLQVVSCGPEALGVGRVGIHAQLTLPIFCRGLLQDQHLLYRKRRANAQADGPPSEQQRSLLTDGWGYGH